MPVETPQPNMCTSPIKRTGATCVFFAADLSISCDHKILLSTAAIAAFLISPYRLQVKDMVSGSSVC
jgi:hypothetical protein